MKGILQDLLTRFAFNFQKNSNSNMAIIYIGILIKDSAERNLVFRKRFFFFNFFFFFDISNKFRKIDRSKITGISFVEPHLTKFLQYNIVRNVNGGSV